MLLSGGGVWGGGELVGLRSIQGLFIDNKFSRYPIILIFHPSHKSRKMRDNAVSVCGHKREIGREHRFSSFVNFYRAAALRPVACAIFPRSPDRF